MKTWEKVPIHATHPLNWRTVSRAGFLLQGWSASSDDRARYQADTMRGPDIHMPLARGFLHEYPARGRATGF